MNLPSGKFAETGPFEGLGPFHSWKERGTRQERHGSYELARDFGLEPQQVSLFISPGEPATGHGVSFGMRPRLEAKAARHSSGARLQDRSTSFGMMSETERGSTRS